MSDKKISQLTGATTPLAGTEVLPIVQSGSTVKVSIDNVTKGRTVNATSFDTDVAAAGVTLSGTTLAADGTNADIDITITPKNAGKVNTKAVWMNSPDGTKQLTFTPGNSLHQILGDYSSGANIPIQIGIYTIPNMLTFNTDGTLSAKNNLKFLDAGDGIDFSAVTDGPGVVITEVLPSYVAGYYDTSMAASTSGTITLAYKTLAYVKVGRMVTVTGEMSIDSVASPVGDISFVLPFTAGPSTGGRMGNSDFVVRAYSFSGGLTGTIYGTIVQNSTTCNLIKIEDFVSAGIASNLQAGTTFIFCFSYIAAS